MPTSKIVELQGLAREIAAVLAPGIQVGWIDVYTADGRRLLTLPVPGCAVAMPAAVTVLPEPPAVAPGWAVGPKGALYDGARVAVAASRLRLLKVLVEADGPIPAKELARLAFDRETDETNVRYHVKELKKELAGHFPEFEGDLVAASGEGYRLMVR